VPSLSPYLDVTGKHRDRPIFLDRVTDELFIGEALEALSALRAAQVVGAAGARRLHAIKGAMRHEDFNEMSLIHHCEPNAPDRHLGRVRHRLDAPNVRSSLWLDVIADPSLDLVECHGIGGIGCWSAADRGDLESFSSSLRYLEAQALERPFDTTELRAHFFLPFAAVPADCVSS
jgi:hypothetical protein